MAGAAAVEGSAVPAGGRDGTPEPAADKKPTVEELREEGNQAFRKAQLLRRTTAGKQYLHDAEVSYIHALGQLGEEPADENTLGLACTIHANLALVFLQTVPPKWKEAEASCDLALTVQPRHAKALYRRALALLEDERQGLPEASIRAALGDLEAASAVEPSNAQVARETGRIRRRLAAIEEARSVPKPRDIAGCIQPALLDRGSGELGAAGYVWGQTESVVHVFVPARGLRIAKSSGVTCEIRAQSLRVALPTADVRFELEGALHRPVIPDDCSWQLEENGLLVHVELAKRHADAANEHWRCVWTGHAETKAQSAEVRRELQKLEAAAARTEPAEGDEAQKHPAAAETLKRMRELCPGVNIEWGDTSLDALRQM